MNAPVVAPPAALPPPRHRSRLKHVLKNLAILILGIVIGSAATAHFGHHLMNMFLADPAKMGERLHSRLDRDLDLTPAQSAKIGQIITDHSTNFANIIKVTRPRLVDEFDQMSAEIRRELNPEQAKSWDKINEHMKKRFPPMFGPPPPPPPPPEANH